MKRAFYTLLALLPVLLLSCGKEAGAAQGSLDDIVFNGPETIHLRAGEAVDLSLEIPSGLDVTCSWVYDKKVLSTDTWLRLQLDVPQEGTLTVVIRDARKQSRTIERSVIVTRTTDTKVIGYLPQYKSLPDIPWNKLTHLHLCFAKVGRDGSLDDAGIRSRFAGLSDKARPYGVRLVLSLGGGGGTDEQEAITAAMLDETARARMVDAAVRTVRDLSLDGVDLDYEGWEWGAATANAARRDAVRDVLKRLRAALGEDAVVSAALAINPLENGWFTSEMAALTDYVGLMAYDKTGTWSVEAGPHAPYDYFTSASETALRMGFPKEKVVPGIPFYGRIFPGGKPSASSILSYVDILKTYPGAESKDAVESEHLWYDGLPMVTRKAQYVKDQKLGGVMVWEITQDSADPAKSLLTAINQTLN